jgi:hypothetical protein
MHIYGEISMLKNFRVYMRSYTSMVYATHTFEFSLIRNSVTGPYNRDQHVYVIAVLKKHENIKHV